MHLSGVDTNLLAPLRALLLHQNVTRAAKEVGLSQSSMSHALSRLRAHFGDPLLIPIGRRLTLTERGKRLIEPVQNAVAQFERVFLQPESFDPATTRRVFKITATDNLELYLLPRLVELLQRQAPGVEVRVTPLSNDWQNELQRGDLDLKLGRKYPVPSSFESQDLSGEDEAFACVARPRHPAHARLSFREYASLGHLVVLPASMTGDFLGGQVDAALAKQGLRRRVVMTVPHFLVAPFIVAQSDLVLTAPVRVVEHFLEHLHLRRLILPMKLRGYRLSQVWAARSGADEGHRWIRGVIAKLLATLA